MIVRKVAFIRDLSQPNQAFTRLLAREARRRAKFAEGWWGDHRPHFDDEQWSRDAEQHTCGAFGLASAARPSNCACSRQARRRERGRSSRPP